MDEIHKTITTQYYTASSKPFRGYLTRNTACKSTTTNTMRREDLEMTSDTLKVGQSQTTVTSTSQKRTKTASDAETSAGTETCDLGQ
jgi:hypothetical protein